MSSTEEPQKPTEEITEEIQKPTEAKPDEEIKPPPPAKIIETPIVNEKPKKERTEAQKAALAKAREKAFAARAAKKEAKTREVLPPVATSSLPKPKQEVVVEHFKIEPAPAPAPAPAPEVAPPKPDILDLRTPPPPKPDRTPHFKDKRLVYYI